MKCITLILNESHPDFNRLSKEPLSSRMPMKAGYNVIEREDRLEVVLDEIKEAKSMDEIDKILKKAAEEDKTELKKVMAQK